MHRLFGDFAHRYDLHTPPGHYKHDHAYVIEQALAHAPADCRLLDVGCGTGVFVEAALAAGIDAVGFDSASEMVDVARRRISEGRVQVKRMQELAEQAAYDVICSLSWTIHYCETASELDDVIARCHRALRPGGLLLLQVANDEAMTGAVNIDREPGPHGEPDDTFFVHRFRALHDTEHSFVADYVYASHAHADLLSESHELQFADPALIANALQRAGFRSIDVYNPTSISPFVAGNAA